MVLPAAEEMLCIKAADIETWRKRERQQLCTTDIQHHPFSLQEHYTTTRRDCQVFGGGFQKIFRGIFLFGRRAFFLAEFRVGFQREGKLSFPL